MANERKFFILMSSGEKVQIDELDFNNLQGRISRGQTKGWYVQRGESFGNKHNWSFQFKDIAGFWSDAEERKNVPVRDIDIKKRVPPKVGKLEEPKSDGCQHDWNNPDHYEYITQIVNGVNRYYKRCLECKSKSQLIKKREVDLAMSAADKTLDDVKVIQG